jgi:phage repressor protein C with HTH and peptisase S24 domain
MTRDPSRKLNRQNAFSRNTMPLGDSLRRDVPEGFRQPGRSADFLFCDFKCAFHESDESMAFFLMQEKLSVNESASFCKISLMETLAERIRYLRKEVMHETQGEFAVPLGVHRQAVTNWESKDAKDGISRENAVAIAKRTGASIGWILDNVGEPPPQREKPKRRFMSAIASDAEWDRQRQQQQQMQQGGDYHPEPDFPPEFSSPEHRGPVDHNGHAVEIPKSGIREIDENAGLGGGQVPAYFYRPGEKGQEVTDAIKPEAWLLPSHFLKDRFKAPPEKIVALSTQGDSMSPTIQHGDVVFVDTRHTRISPSGLYALRDIYGEMIIKRLDAYRVGDSYTVKITSDNPHEPTREEPLSEVSIVGRVCGIIKSI